MVQAIRKELALRKDYLGTEEIRSIYFGGGTPSLLNEKELTQILESIFRIYKVGSDVEITLEANPDDLSAAALAVLNHSGINRLSIGVQTFDDKRLKFINRTHSAQEAKDALTCAKEAGFDNITADLMYAIPPGDLAYWEKDLNLMLSFDLPHLSIYGLTIEEKTVFGQWVRKGLMEETIEDVAAKQYQLAIDVLTSHGYEHYEVSNFTKPGMYSRHNSAYWDDQKYLGVGPGAHSYNGSARSYTVSNNAKFISAIHTNTLPLTTEKLTSTQKANEYLLTHLRTRHGVNLSWFQEHFEKDLFSDHRAFVNQMVHDGLAEMSFGKLKLTSKGFLVADEIALKLFNNE